MHFILQYDCEYQPILSSYIEREKISNSPFRNVNEKENEYKTIFLRKFPEIQINISTQCLNAFGFVVL